MKSFCAISIVCSIPCTDDFDGLCFVNLVDFDANWGHRRNPVGYAEEIEKFDVNLGKLLEVLKEDLKNRFIEEFNITIIRINNNQVKEFTFYERGVGYTLNCGSGTLCGAYILYLKGLLKNNRLCLNDDLVVEITSKELIITGVSKLICWGKYNE